MLPSQPRPSVSQPNRLAGFTLVELLVVIAIIGILSAIVVTVATRVTKGGQRSATTSILQRVDSMYTTFLQKNEGSVVAYIRTRKTQSDTNDITMDQLDPDEYLFPLVDGRYEGRPPPAEQFDPALDPALPTGALLLLEMAEIPEIAESIASIDPKFIQRRDVLAWGWRLDANTRLPTGQAVKRRLRIPVVVDGFGNPIRFVHQAFSGGYGPYFFPATGGGPGPGGDRWRPDGSNPTHPIRTARRWKPPFPQPPPPLAPPAPSEAMFSRSYRPFDLDTASSTLAGDADEGIGPAGRAYFYSPGPDADPGTRRDNVYTTQPTFPPETNNID